MKLIRYLESWFHVTAGGGSEAKYEAGKFYPVAEETSRHVTHGIAEVVDAPGDADKAQAIAESAEGKAEKAFAVAAEARASADAAAAAVEITRGAK